MKIFDDLDALIIPGTRNTVNNVVELKKSGVFDRINEIAKKIPIFRICGGYQMLSKKIIDENHLESKYGTVDGLSLLDIETKFGE